MLDINSGAVFSNMMGQDPRYADNNFVEPMLMPKLIEPVQDVVDVPLCIDSSVPGALEAGAAAAKGRPLVNSVTGEEERLEKVLPLVKKYNVAVVAISNDDTGISEDPDVRFAVAKKIVERARRFRHPGPRHRGRSAGDADRRHGDGRPPGLRAGAPPARGAGRQHHLRRLEHLLRPAEPPRHQQRLPADGDAAPA